jgi:gas vesicle protein
MAIVQRRTLHFFVGAFVGAIAGALVTPLTGTKLGGTDDRRECREKSIVLKAVRTTAKLTGSTQYLELFSNIRCSFRRSNSGNQRRRGKCRCYRRS